MAQFDSPRPQRSASSLAMSGVINNYSSNLDSHPDMSDEDQDWSDFDADVTPAQTTQTLEAKIKNQATQIVDLEDHNSNLSQRITELDHELSEVKRQNQVLVENASLLAVRLTDQQDTSNDYEEYTAENEQDLDAALSGRVSSHYDSASLGRGRGPQ